MSILKFLMMALVLVIGQNLVNCGFSDPLDNPANVDHVITSLKVPKIKDNTTTAAAANLERQAFFPMSTFATLGSMGGLRTIMMGGMLYGLSLIPAVMMAMGGNGLSGIMSSLKLRRDTSSAKLPLLSESQTRRLLQMLHSAFRQWNVADDLCKQLFVCQMYRQVSQNGVSPDLELFKEALLHMLEKGGHKRAGRAAEQLLNEYNHYFVAAKLGMDQDNCEEHYQKCNLSLYPKGDGFKKVEKKTKAKSTTL
ncbi:uncharacterized protein [Parasteatoda tepidariorum]|uniref:uncharacterized protein n=1 Tax=Parasteatoda tepidariorum TaxID=114398 RepID=UPI00077F8204|nr:uncharacterized protein LOC107437566 [Parasteatoda tepidariorum]